MERPAYLKLFQTLSDEDFGLLSERLQTKFFKKGEFVTLPGQVQRNLYFVKSGVQMSYFESETKLHVIAFTYGNNLCAIPESFARQLPSKYHLICLADSEMSYVSFVDLQELFNKCPKLERIFREMTEMILAGIIDRHTELHTLTIEDRYKAFCQRSPHLLQLVAHKYIASYLGIDPTNFSKLYNKVRI